MGYYDNPPYYLTAYGIAVKHGYQGTEEDFVRDIYGGAERAAADAALAEAARVSAQASAVSAGESKTAAAGSAEAAADSEAAAKNYADHIADPVGGIVTQWIEDNLQQETGYVIDGGLTVANAAADAKVVGDNLSTALQLATGSKYTTVIPNNTDYDNLLTPANMVCNSSSAAQSMSHCPTSQGHRLFILYGVGPERVIQIVITSSATVSILRRYYDGTTWSSWLQLANKAEVEAQVQAAAALVYDYNSFDVFQLDQNGEDKTSAGLTFTRNEDNSWTIDGTATGTAFCNMISGNAALPAHIIPGRSYYLDTHGASVPIRVYFTQNGSPKIYGEFSKNTTITVPPDATGCTMRWQIASGTVFANQTVRYTLTALPPNVPAVNFNGTAMCLLGDSIVAGRLGDQPAGSGVRPDMTYDQRISSQLNILCDNKSVGGMGWLSTANHSENAMDYIDRIMSSLVKYNLLWLEYGGNDSSVPLGSYTDAPATREEVSTIMGAIYYTLTQIYNTYPTVQVVLATPVLGRMKESDTSQSVFPSWAFNIRRLGGWTMAELCEEYDKFGALYHVHIIHLENALNSWHLRKISDGEGGYYYPMMGYWDNETDTQTDNLHPTNAGFEVLTRYVVGQLRTLI